MRIAALFDIHGNLTALDAVIADLRAAAVDAVVVGGDVLPGPMPRETLERLLSLEVPTHFLFGNGEVAVLAEMSGQPSRLPPTYQPLIAWNARQMAAHAQALRAWPMTVAFEVPGLGRVLFCHATPRNEDEIFTRLTPEERLLPVVAVSGAAVVVCGHTHMPFDRRVGVVRVVNAGSIGMPFGRQGADWLLLDGDVHLRHTQYDVAAAAEIIAATPCPLAREFFAHNLLQPPSEAQMLAAYEAAALT